jgi:putative tryptophan/tyrosine transport system substrate-binding protein
MPEVSSAADITRSVEGFASQPDGGLIALPSPWTGTHRDLIIQLATERRLPAIYPFPSYVKVGGLISYGIDPLDLFHDAAAYVDRILRGTKPADLPIQLPTKFRMTINLRTAKAIGLTIPESFPLRADEVIE